MRHSCFGPATGRVKCCPGACPRVVASSASRSGAAVVAVPVDARAPLGFDVV